MEFKDNTEIVVEKDNLLRIGMTGFRLSAHNFAYVMGASKWNSKGKAILNIMGTLKSDFFDDYYGYRGDVAEKLVVQHIEKTYKPQFPNLKLDTWKKEQFKKDSYNQFPNSKKFSAMLDIGMTLDSIKFAETKDLSLKVNVEIKSKSMKMYEEIIEKKNYPKEEVLQGQFSSTLCGLSKVSMAWVFFTEEQENQLKYLHSVNEEFVDQIPLNNVVIKMINFSFDIEEMKSDMNQCFEDVCECIRTGIIPMEYFSKEERADILRYNEKQLPF